MMAALAPKVVGPGCWVRVHAVIAVTRWAIASADSVGNLFVQLHAQVVHDGDLRRDLTLRRDTLRCGPHES